MKPFAAFIKRMLGKHSRPIRRLSRRMLGIEHLESRVVPSGLALQFGTPTSLVESGYTKVTLAAFNSTTGYGWESINGMVAVNRVASSPLLSGVQMGHNSTFLANLPDGQYDVDVTLGDAGAAHSQMSVATEGQTLAIKISTPKDQTRDVRGRVTITDGQLSVQITDGVKNGDFGIVALTVTPVSPTATSLFSDAAILNPSTSTNSSAWQLGLKFQPLVNGTITGVQFYKSATNTGTHVGYLWSATGQLLAKATFTAETASGWQTVSFSDPVTVTAGTTYIVSYTAPKGHFTYSLNFFTISGFEAGEIEALGGSSAANGVYSRNLITVPKYTYVAANYWVDVVFQPNIPDPVQSTASFATSSDPSGLVDTLTIVVKDAAGNVVSGIPSNEFNLSLSGGSSTGSFGTVTQTSTPGTYSVPFTGGISGTADELNLSVEGVQISSNPTMQVTPGAVSGTKTTVNFAISTDASGTGDLATIVVKDAAGNAVTGLSGSAFSLSMSGGTSTGSIGSVSQTTTPGTYTATYTGNVAGTAETLKTTINSVQITSQPTVQVVAGAVSASKTTVSFASGTDQSGATDAVTIVVEDAAGNPVTGLASGVFSLSLSGGTSTGTISAVSSTSTSGTYSATFTGNAAGTADTLNTTINSIQITSQPTVQVVAGAVSGTKTTVSFASGTDQSGATDTVTIVVEDAAGNPVTGLAIGAFTLSLSGGTSTGTISAVSSTSTPGTYTTTYTGNVAGTAETLKTTINSVQITSQPTVQVVAGAVSASKTTVSFASGTDQSGATDAVTIVVEDAAGNPVTGLASGAFSLSLSGGTSTGTISAVSSTSTPGTYSASFTGNAAGTADTLNTTINSIQITSQPTVQVVAGAVSGTKSTVSFASGTDNSGTDDPVTIVVEDAAGNPVTGLASSAFNFNLSGGTSTGTFGTVSSSTPGTYTATFTGTAAGTAATLTLTMSGIQISSQPTVSVINGTPPGTPTNLAALSASQSEINLTWSLADTTDTSVVIQRAASASGPFQTLITLPANENIYTDTSCWASTTYYYRIYAANAAGASGYSSVVSAETQAIESGSMNIVTNLKVVAKDSTTATITFTDTNTNLSSYNYFLERSSNGLLYQVVASLDETTSDTDVGLTPGTTYHYRVRGGSQDASDSDYSAPVSITMPAQSATLPVAPSQLAPTDFSATSVQLTWQNNDPNNPDFQIYRAPYNAYSPMSFSLIATTAAGATTYTDTSLSAEMPYAYEVRAINSAGTSDFATPSDIVQQELFGTAVGVVTASAGTGSPKTYNIGPGQTYPTINSLNWSTLGPGDTVNIYYQAGGYPDIIQIAERGTPAAWITINGIPDPTTGALPVIEGANAVLNSQFESFSSEVTGGGLVVIGPGTGYTDGYQPGYIKIENLQIQDAYSGSTYKNSSGQNVNYNLGAAGIYMVRADHVLIQNDIIDNNGQGVFGAGQSSFDWLMTNITLDGNQIYGNGEVNQEHYHNSYIEGIDTVYEYNYYGPVRSGSGGAGIKDRGVGTIIKYNYIDGGSYQIDLPEAQNEDDLAVADPAYHDTYVFGNVIVSPAGDGNPLIYFGGDQGVDVWLRKGVLYVYNNTFVIESNFSEQYRMDYISVTSSGESVDVRNNIFAVEPDGGGQSPYVGLVCAYANVYFGNNWVPDGYEISSDNGGFTGNAGGLGNLIQGTGNDPGFVNAAARNYQQASGSIAIGASGPLSGNESANGVDDEYVATASGTTRSNANDLGAFEYGT